MNITQILQRGAQINGNGTAVIFGEREWTYSQVQERVSKFAGALQKLGITDGERVAVIALASDRFVELYFSVPWAGGVIVPLNFRLAPPELAYMINDAGAKVLIVDDAFSEMISKLDGQLETVEHIIFMGDGETPAGALNYETLVAETEPAEDAGRGGDDTLGIFYTGGTTGLSKGVMTSHSNMLNELMALTHEYIGEEQLKWLCVTPFSHVTGSVPVYSTIANVGQFILYPRFDIVETMQGIQKYKANMIFLVPTMIAMVLNHPQIKDFDLTSLKEVLYGASPMPLAVVRKAMDLLPNAKFLHVYGMTETTGIATLLKPKFHVPEGELSHIKSAGHSVIRSQIKIVDADDNELPRGEIGELLIRGGSVMKGYWNQPELTETTMRGGWMHSGDVGYMDEEGFLYLVDRLKDMIISGGENVYSVEVENAIYQHPDVAMCAVIGIPSDEWGETVQAIVMLKEGRTVTEKDIINHCRERIAHFKCPRSVTFTEDLPMSATGKILKHVLRQPYWEGFEKGIN